MHINIPALLEIFSADDTVLYLQLCASMVLEVQTHRLWPSVTAYHSDIMPISWVQVHNYGDVL